MSVSSFRSQMFLDDATFFFESGTRQTTRLISSIMASSIRFDETEINDSTDFGALVVTQLKTGFLGRGNVPVDGISDMYEVLCATPFHGELCMALAGAIELGVDVVNRSDDP